MEVIMARRHWKKYDFKEGNTIKHSGITTDLDRREEEHQKRWPSGHIKQVGNATTEDAARKWEETKQKTITPRRK
jgi:predicted GIY-YIG superfamily endonuclease